MSRSGEILDAAAELFVREGVAAVGMGEIAAAAGCSRATLYRHFESREVLHLAYVDREAARLSEQIATAVGGIADPADRLVTAMTTAVSLVREHPGLAVWFQPGERLGGELAAGSVVVDRVVGGFLLALGVPDASGLRTSWLIRVIVSLVTYPEPGLGAERELLVRFVVPGVIG